MWPRLRKQIAVEQAELAHLLEFYDELLSAAKIEAPVGTDLAALSAFLHSLYTGIENFFRRITIELGDELPTDKSWHRRLLRQMTEPTARRSVVISQAMHDRLTGYLDFRHLFRNLYLPHLEWERMEALVLGAGQLFIELCAELDAFAERMETLVESKADTATTDPEDPRS